MMKRILKHRYLLVSAWCMAGFVIFFSWFWWVAVGAALVTGWYLGLHRPPSPDSLRLVHDVDEEGIEPSRLKDTGS